MRLAVFLGTCAAAAIAIPAAAGAVTMQRGQDSDASPVRQDVERGGLMRDDMRQGKDRLDRFESSRVGTRIREKDDSRRSVLPARQEDHPTTDPHDTHGTPDPHDTPTDPHDPHGTPDPHDSVEATIAQVEEHPTTDPHDTHGTPDPHDTPTDPHDPHDVPTDPHDTLPD